MCYPPFAIYLNNAATAWPKAPGVIKAIQLALDKPPMHPGRSATRSTDVVTECRELLTDMLNVTDPDRIVLTMSSTHALNLAISGLGLAGADNVITTVTEHNSVLRPLNHLKQRYGIRVTTIGLDSQGSLDSEAFDRELTKSPPTLVAINHASNVTGRINDVRSLFAKAKAVGATTLLDASQTLGYIPVHPTEIYTDLVAFTGHKGLRGPTGTGGLYVAPHIELEQVFVGGTGVRSDLALHPPDMPMRLEAGTLNIHDFAGLAAALRWGKNNDEFHLNEERLAHLLREGLGNIPGVTLFDDFENVARTGIVSFRLDNWQVEETGYILKESFGIICRTGLHCAPLIHEAIGSAPEGTVRFSVSGFNTEKEIETAIAAVERLART